MKKSELIKRIEENETSLIESAEKKSNYHPDAIYSIQPPKEICKDSDSDMWDVYISPMP